MEVNKVSQLKPEAQKVINEIIAKAIMRKGESKCEKTRSSVTSMEESTG